jgi:ribonuclease P protein subunit RPR2
VADALDAMTTDRPYRPGASFERARTEIAAAAGRQFDPEVVAVLDDVSDEHFAHLRARIG